MNWRDRRVFVTGASGIVGSWLVRRLLAEGAAVVALVHDADPQSELIRRRDIDAVSVINGALEDYATLERAINEHEIDTVFHLGAQPIVTTALRSPVPTFEANIRGTWNVLEACRVHRDLVKRVVVASQRQGLRRAWPRSRTRKTCPSPGRHPYDVSKSCADLLAMTYAETYGLPVAVARCGNIYGGGDLNWSRIVPGTIRSLLAGERPVIRSDGQYVRDYIYVEDVVDAYLALGEAADREGVRGEAFNFSPETQVKVIEVVDAIRRLMGCSHVEPVVLNKACAEIRDQWLDASKAGRVLGWRAAHTLDAGLEKTVAWYREFLGRVAA